MSGGENIKDKHNIDMAIIFFFSLLLLLPFEDIQSGAP